MSLLRSLIRLRMFRSKKKDQPDDAVVEKNDVAVADVAPTTKQAKPMGKAKQHLIFLATI